MELEDNKRRRRISEQEEAALLAVAAPYLRSMIIAALDTGMRRGEMLALRFGDVDWQARRIVLRGATTKSRKTRVVPIGTTRLMAVLEWLRLDAEGGRKPDEMLVFSNEVGEPFKTFKRAWTIAVLKAHGVDPRWRKGSYKDLDAASLQRLRDIDLHWHDIRHEYASRLVEKGVPLAQVRDLLGHASILTTERYDNQKMEALQAAVERLETGKTFDPQASPSAEHVRPARDIGLVRRSTLECTCEGGSFKFLSRSAPPALERRTGSRPLKIRKCLIQLWVGVWYRYGDSNPGPVAENHVS